MPTPTAVRRTLRRRPVLVAAALAVGLGATAAAPTSAAPAAHRLVSSARLPDGFQPEGIDTATLDGRTYAFLGSMRDGSIYRVDLATGAGAILSPRAPSPSIGLEVDRRGRLFVAAGLGGAVNGDAGAGARVVDARSGRVLASYRFSTGPALVNDVTVTAGAAWFTDTINPVLYELPLGRDGALPAADGFRVVPIKGAYRYDASASTVDGNGISPTPDGRALLVIQYRTGILYRLDPRTGTTREVDLGGLRFPKGDGLTLRGRRLYVPQNTNVLDVVVLDARGDRGRLVRRVHSSSFDVPTNVAQAGGRLYLPTARLQVPSPRTARYALVSVPVPG